MIVVHFLLLNEQVAGEVTQCFKLSFLLSGFLMILDLPKFEKAKILVVGDVMLDRYWYGSTTRISPEAPVPVVKVEEIEDCPGGAGNVALNIAALGSLTWIIGVTGADEAAKILQGKLEAADVFCHFTKLVEAPTITKLRVMSQHQQLIRLDQEKFYKDLHSEKIEDKVAELIANVDAIVLSDYNKGTLAKSYLKK